uniref:Uncharacterized protein n=1 Tax=Mola mola TaxID=94237 RepID=A0A3Q3WZQ5_MOLML
VSSPKQTPKRCSSTSPEAAPPHKSPRTDVPSPITHMPNAGEPQSDNVEEPTGPPGSPTARRKSWRRATMTRRSLPALPNLYQVEHLKKEWTCLAKIISSEHPTSTSSSDPSVQRAMEKVRKATNLQGESECWEALLKKHRTKAEELEKVEQGLERGVLLDSTSLAQSSQHHFIQSKPDYHSVLRRQQPMLHTMMDIQSKMVRELMFFKDQSQLLVKETSGRL